MKENEIPKGKRNYFIPRREDVFEQDGKYYIFMGAWPTFVGQVAYLFVRPSVALAKQVFGFL